MILFAQLSKALFTMLIAIVGTVVTKLGLQCISELIVPLSKSATN